MNFIGNQKIIDRLNLAVSRKIVNHAYLFSGPEAVGKFLAAKLFSNAVIEGSDLIKSDFFEPALDHSDCLLLAPETEEKKGIVKTKDIPIDDVRDVQYKLSLYPLSGKKKVLIIRDAHRLTIAAQSALLKTLEEPADTTMIILVTHDAGRLLPTIHSRCQTLNFSLASSEEISILSEINKVPSENKHLIEQLSFGRPGRFSLFMSNSEERERWSEMISSSRKMNQLGMTEKLALAEKLSKNANRAQDFLKLWLWVIHEDNLRAGTLTDSVSLLDLISKTQNTITSTNANVRLLLDNAFLRA